jgi:hypothetical protein
MSSSFLHNIFSPFVHLFYFYLKDGSKISLSFFFLLLLLIFLDIKLTCENDFLHMVAGIF